MTKMLLIMLLTLPLQVFALACPTTGAMAEKGDSLAQVLQACGEPLAKHSYEASFNRVERWTYYPNVPNTNIRTKITLLMRENRLENITLQDNILANCLAPVQPNNPTLVTTVPCSSESHYNNMMFCQTNFTAGDSAQAIVRACGEPMTREVLQEDKAQIVEMQYGTITPNIWVFRNEILTDFR